VRACCLAPLAMQLVKVVSFCSLRCLDGRCTGISYAISDKYRRADTGLVSYTSAHTKQWPEVLCFTAEVSFSFFFRQRISEMALPTGTFIAQMVGYRSNFKNWVQNLGGDLPLKFGGPQFPQCCEPKSEDVVQTYSRNRP